eukprot:11284391-Alexandrium_andersonii.AAC.1
MGARPWSPRSTSRRRATRAARRHGCAAPTGSGCPGPCRTRNGSRAATAFVRVASEASLLVLRPCGA